MQAYTLLLNNELQYVNAYQTAIICNNNFKNKILIYTPNEQQNITYRVFGTKGLYRLSQFCSCLEAGFNGWLP